MGTPSRRGGRTKWKCGGEYRIRRLPLRQKRSCCEFCDMRRFPNLHALFVEERRQLNWRFAWAIVCSFFLAAIALILEFLDR